MSCWCCGSILVSYTRGGRFEPFYCNDKYSLNSLNSVKIFRKTPMLLKKLSLFEISMGGDYFEHQMTD